MQNTKQKKTPNAHTQNPKPDSSSSHLPVEPPVTVERRTQYSSVYKWAVPNFTNIKAKFLNSPYFEVGGFDFRVLMYPKGDSSALPGHISLYLQINDPRWSNFDCYAVYRLTIVNASNVNKSLCRDGFYRFSKNKKCIGWSEFTVSKTVMDTNCGFLDNGSLLVSVDVRVLDETVSFPNDGSISYSASGNIDKTNSVVLSGKVTWTIRNYGLFKDMIKTQKMISPGFRVGGSNLRIKLYKSVASGVEYLSLFLETKDADCLMLCDTSCWCMFRISVLNQNPGSNHMHRDYYGRFGINCPCGDDISLGWAEYMKMSDFVDNGFLVDDNTVVISVTFNSIKESTAAVGIGSIFGSKNATGGVVKKNDGYAAKFVWKIENFVKLKDILKKKRMTSLCIKSKRFQVANVNFRLLLYPRGQSQKPLHLSLFLEVLAPGNAPSDWSSFVIYRLAVMNKVMDKAIVRESQKRCSKAMKDLGWSEFMTLTSLFDQDCGYLDQEAAVFSAEVQILKETFMMKDITDLSNKGSLIDLDGKRWSVTWKLENFLSLKEALATGKICSKYFLVGGCELQIGVYESFEYIWACLEIDPSIVSDPDENFWVSYRITLINQKDPAKSLRKESSLFTRTCTNSNLQFMNISDLLEADAGFVVRDMIIFHCEIFNCCPWFEFSEPDVSKHELLALDNDRVDSSSEIYELHDSENGKLAAIFKELMVGAGCYFIEDNSQRILSNLKELLIDTGLLAKCLIGLRIYLDDRVKEKCLICQTKLSSSSVRKNVDGGAHQSSTTQDSVMVGIKVLQQTINDLLLDIMVECCQPLNACIKDSHSASSKHSTYTNTTACPSESHWKIGPAVFLQSSDNDGVCASSYDVDCSVVKGNDVAKMETFGKSATPPESSASGPVDHRCSGTCEVKWPEPSKELLRLIIVSLKTLDGPISLVHPEPRQRSQSAEKVFLLLEKAPKLLQPALVILLPKLIHHSEHPLAACALLDQLQKPNVEPELQALVLATISQLKLDNEGWKQTFYRASQLLGDSCDEYLGATINFLFKAASQCQHIPQAVRAVRARLQNLGAEISPNVMDILSKTVKSQHEIAEAMLKEIDSVFALDDKCLENPSEPSSNGGNSYSFDIFVLIDMLATPSLAIEASQAFERGVALGFIEHHSVAMVLERHAQRTIIDPINLAENYQHESTAKERNAESLCPGEVFTSVLALAKTLSLSGCSQVHNFLKMFYATLFRLFAGESYYRRMLRGLVDHATSPADNCSEISLNILVFLVDGDHGLARPVLSMMKDSAEHANADHSAIWHQLHTIEEEISRTRDEIQAELSNMGREKAIVLERLTESEAAVDHYKSEMGLAMDRFVHEKRELCRCIKAVESQIEQFRSKCNDEVAQLSKERKDSQDCLHRLEAQLLQLKSQKRHELKKAVKDNKVLAEKLRNAEAEREKFNRELKRYTSEATAQEEVQQTLIVEIRQLKQKAEQIEAVKKEKEKEVQRCRTYSDYIEEQLNTCQQRIHSLQKAIQDEMLQHAPLYNVGLEDLSMKELETLSLIHEDGLKRIHALLPRAKGSGPSGDPVSSANTFRDNSM